MSNRDLFENSMGVLGFEVITDTAVHVAPTNKTFCGFTVMADCVIATIDADITGNAITGLTFTTGMTIPVQFQKVSLTSGQIIAYKGV